MDLSDLFQTCDHLPIAVREFTEPGKLVCTQCGAVLAEPKAERLAAAMEEAA